MNFISLRNAPVGLPLETSRVPGRECGSCVACCVTLKIDEPELKKEPDEVCMHCTGAGCGIYEARPMACRDWHCLWRRLAALPEEARPDKVGVMLTVQRNPASPDPFGRLAIVARSLNSEEDFRRPEARAAINVFVAEGSLPVYLHNGKRSMLIHPPVEIARAVVGQTPTPEHVRGEVATWRSRLGLADAP